jgi:hypothetical protein
MELSFTERYRGTEFDTGGWVVLIGEPIASRGRAFVLVSGAAALALMTSLLTSGLR